MGPVNICNYISVNHIPRIIEPKRKTQANISTSTSPLFSLALQPPPASQYQDRNSSLSLSSRADDRPHLWSLLCLVLSGN
jgi:hypothetical protein